MHIQKSKMTHILNCDLNQYLVTIYHWMDLLTNLIVAVRAQEQVQIGQKMKLLCQSCSLQLESIHNNKSNNNINGT